MQDIDVYFNGNDRNFMKTDEALRLRSVRDLDAGTCETFITYKGPKLDQASSTRMEFETAVGDLSVMKDLLAALGYKEVFTVDKTRQEWKHYICQRHPLSRQRQRPRRLSGAGDFGRIRGPAGSSRGNSAAVSERPGRPQKKT